jgi:hypothetical protein
VNKTVNASVEKYDWLGLKGRSVGMAADSER